MENRILMSVGIILLLATMALVWWIWSLPSSQTIAQFDERLTLLETGLRPGVIPNPSQTIAATQAVVTVSEESEPLQQLEVQIAKFEATLQALAKRADDMQAKYAQASVIYQPTQTQTQEQDAVQEAADQRHIMTTLLTQMDDRHARQAVEPVWAGAKEEDMWSAYEQASMQQGIELNTIDCRVDTCTLDFNLPPASDGFPPEHDLEKWVFAHAGNCAYTIEGSTPDESDVGSTRRVWLHDCQ